MALIKTLKKPILPDTAFIIWDKKEGKVVKAGLLVVQHGASNFWNIVSKDSDIGIDLDEFIDMRYLILDGRHYDENPDEIFDLPKVPNIDIK